MRPVASSATARCNLDLNRGWGPWAYRRAVYDGEAERILTAINGVVSADNQLACRHAAETQGLCRFMRIAQERHFFRQCMAREPRATHLTTEDWLENQYGGYPPSMTRLRLGGGGGLAGGGLMGGGCFRGGGGFAPSLSAGEGEGSQ